MRKSTPQPRLFGPDTQHGAWRLPTLRRYVWHAVWYEKGRQRKQSLSVEYGGDYQAAFASWLARWVQDGGKIEAKAAVSDSILVTDALNAYLTTRGPGAESSAQLANRCVTLGTFFFNKSTGEITEKDCRAYAASRASLGTARLELGTLSSALNFCVHERLISRRPKIWRPPEPVSNKDALTRGEAARLIQALRRRGPSGKHVLLASLIAFYTAARITSVLGLGWQRHADGGHVDLARGLIDFNTAGRSQTVKQKPIIKIPRKLLPHLRAAHKLGRPMVCVGRRGVVPCLRVFEKTFKSAAVDAGLPESVTPHTLCHTRITWLVDKDVPIEKVSAFTGRSIERLEETYLHLRAASFKSIDDAI